MKLSESMKIERTIGGPCIYARGILPDGRETGRVLCEGQNDETLRQELLETLKSGRDDVHRFVNRIFSQ